MSLLARLEEFWYGPARCGDQSTGYGTCLLSPGHSGFHKSNFNVWPNAADPLDWADIGRRYMLGEAMPYLSLVEIKYAIEAAGAYYVDPTP
jgi:hypothetical protein